jgi:hypothetical protein
LNYLLRLALNHILLILASPVAKSILIWYMRELEKVIWVGAKNWLVKIGACGKKYGRRKMRRRGVRYVGWR